jgi:hypothetical protein
MADAQHLTHLVEQAGWSGQGQLLHIKVQHLAIQ